MTGVDHADGAPEATADFARGAEAHAWKGSHR
jgi:hypothetical protein